MKAFLVYWLVMIVLYEKTLVHIKRILQDDELHDKYPGFKREDKHWFTRRWAYYPTLWLFLPRFILTALAMFVMALGCTVLSIGLPKGKNVKVTGLRYVLMRILVAVCSRVAIFGISMAWWVRTLRPKICYKKYLGPDWKADYDGFCSTMVANHQAF